MPLEWEELPLKRLIYVKSGDMITADDEAPDGNPIYGGNGIRGFTELSNACGPMVLLGRVGAKCGCVHLVSAERFWASEHALRVFPRRRLCLGWLAYLLEVIDFNRLATRTAQPLINGNTVESHPAVLPPIDEQRAIAAFLDRETARIDALVARKRRLIDLLAEQRTALITHAVTKGLDAGAATKPTRFEWLTDAPSHWKVRAFRYSARIPNGQVDPEATAFRDLPLIAPNHIESGTGRLLPFETAAEQAAESGKYFFDAGSVLYSKIRPALAKVCIAPERGLCSADMYPIAPRIDLRAKFLMYFMLSRTFTAAVILMSDRVAMPKINRRDLGAFPIFVPPLAEQDAIIARIERAISAIDALADREHSAIATLREYRSAVISAAVTGTIDVRTACGGGVA